MTDPEDPGGAGDPLWRILVADEQALPVDVEAVCGLARHALASLDVPPGAELSILLVSPDRMAGLKGAWMGEAAPTDVLAFPMDAVSGGPVGSEPYLLGDVVLCPAVAERQAAQAGHSTRQEMSLLLVHGILHLLGHDHAKDRDATRMRAEERRVLDSFAGARR